MIENLKVSFRQIYVYLCYMFGRKKLIQRTAFEKYINSALEL